MNIVDCFTYFNEKELLEPGDEGYIEPTQG